MKIVADSNFFKIGDVLKTLLNANPEFGAGDCKTNRSI
jgi:hypothetical protein